MGKKKPVVIPVDYIEEFMELFHRYCVCLNYLTIKSRIEERERLGNYKDSDLAFSLRHGHDPGLIWLKAKSLENSPVNACYLEDLKNHEDGLKLLIKRFWRRVPKTKRRVKKGQTFTLKSEALRCAF